jgi:hypothetical protein
LQVQLKPYYDKVTDQEWTLGAYLRKVARYARLLALIGLRHPAVQAFPLY